MTNITNMNNMNTTNTTQAQTAAQEGIAQGSTPFALNLKNLPDVGHTLVVGPPGLGMSVHLVLLAHRCRSAANKQSLAEVRESPAQHDPLWLTHRCDGRSISQELPNPSL